MTKKQKNKTIEDKDETIIEMAPIIKEKYTKLFVIISLTLSSLSIGLTTFFFIWFSSNDFEEKSLIERHRMVYAILDEMLKKEIHALSIEARTVEE